MTIVTVGAPKKGKTEVFMKTDTLISSYECNVAKFSRTHTVGSVLDFENPCIGYIKKGNAQFLYKGKSYFAKEGDLIYIAKGTKYYSVWSGTPGIEFYSVHFSFVKPYSFYEYRFQIVRGYPGRLLDEMYNSDDIYISVSHLYRLLSELYKRMAKEPVFSGKTAVRPAIDYIESNYNMPVTIDTLAGLCHMSSSGLFKLFKSATGVTPISYKHNIMIQNALDLLMHTDMTVEEVSERVGFSSSNYFRKVFFDVTGKTPKEVR